MNKRECAKEIEKILAETRVPLFSLIREFDAEGTIFFRNKDYFSALLSKSKAGRGYELYGKGKDACFSYDRASLAANRMGWDNVRLILNNKVYHLHQGLGDEKDCAYSLTKIASCYLSLWQPEEAKRFLGQAGELFHKTGVQPSSFKLYRDISRMLD